MSNKTSNYPNAQLERLASTDFSQKTVNSLMELSRMGIPKTTEELEDRINAFWDFCGSHNLRVGIESLSLALGVSRQAFWQWCNGSKGSEWADICLQAKQVTIAYLEQANMSGHLNPASAIFLMKNLAGYRDAISFDETTPKFEEKRAISVSELRRLGDE